MKALGVLVTAPIPGRVKPKLTAEVGPSTAAEVYWRVGRRVVEAVVGSGYRTIVWFTPAGEGPFVREWLDGVGRVEFRSQSGYAPATRVPTAVARLFAEGARPVVLVGTDFPGVDRRLVTQAFAVLGERDVVLGPAADGVLTPPWYEEGMELFGYSLEEVREFAMKALERRLKVIGLAPVA